MIENTYGTRKRLDFVVNCMNEYNPKRVLDMGCGTGANLTEPLAERFPSVQFIGIDSDKTSIEFAQRGKRHRNADYALLDEMDTLGRFDLVIASEVIEHVEDPDAFLAFLKNRLTGEGKIVITLPNGYGPFEIASLLEVLMQLSGLYPRLQKIKRLLKGISAAQQTADTLAISPHINFFSYPQITETISNCGLHILKYRPRTLLCGFGFDQIIKSDRLIAWNARIADALPPAFSSDWMFVLEAAKSRKHTPYRRNGYARFRRYLNEKRWNLR
ncbi:MAG: methyltransferase domain-containing protein [Rectinemataceae bacterium]|nr:methyltransferase domain-containing protein [Rectinemataceae bacterium]